MAETNESGPADLSGTVDERIAQLASLEGGGEELTSDWLRRQLHAALAEWAADETQVDIEVERRSDY